MFTWMKRFRKWVGLPNENLPVYKPWGHYVVIEEGGRHKVKHLVLSPGQCISLQMHYHRSEHWVIISGVARILRGRVVYVLAEGKSVFIPLMTKHQLENPGRVDLHVIEVQVGECCEEEDIVRYGESFGENKSENSI